jgi:uncharacterized protein (DUF952 family)
VTRRPARAKTIDRTGSLGQERRMLVYKIFRRPEWDAFRANGETLGAPVDLADGYVHLSTAAQVTGTAAKHFAGESDLVLVALEARRWARRCAGSRRAAGDLFPHLYRPLRPRMSSGTSRCRWAPRATSSPKASSDARANGAVPPYTGSTPSAAHDLALKALRAGLVRGRGPVVKPRLRVRFAGLDLPNPLGLGGGIRQERRGAGAACRGWASGFWRSGAATPRPQPGNPRPRLFQTARGPRHHQSLRFQQ